jgi:hypothetical protein
MQGKQEREVEGQEARQVREGGREARHARQAREGGREARQVREGGREARQEGCYDHAVHMLTQCSKCYAMPQRPRPASPGMQRTSLSCLPCFSLAPSADTLPLVTLVPLPMYLLPHRSSLTEASQAVACRRFLQACRSRRRRGPVTL